MNRIMELKLELENKEVVSVFGSLCNVGKTSIMLMMFLEAYLSNKQKTVIFTDSVKHTLLKINKVLSKEDTDTNIDNIFFKHVNFNYGLDEILDYVKKHGSVVNILIDDVNLKLKDLFELRDKTDCKIISTTQLNRDVVNKEYTNEDVMGLIDKGVLETHIISRNEDNFKLKYNNTDEISFKFDFDTFSLEVI